VGSLGGRGRRGSCNRLSFRDEVGLGGKFGRSGSREGELSTYGEWGVIFGG
jgi:hypothetical protein